MPKDVIITPASGKLDFYATTGGSVLANINLTDNNDLSLSTTSGNLIIGDASRDVYIGDGTNEVDIVFEQNGEIRSLAGKYITVNAGTVNATGVAVNTSSPTAVMHVYGSTPSGTVLNVEGTNGSLFSVVDNLDGTLMSVNNNAGLPVLEVFSDDSIIGGRFGQNDFVVSSSGNVGIGVANPSSKLEVNGTVTATTLVKSGGTSSQFLKADGSVDSTAYTTNTGTVTSVSGTGTVSGLTLTGTVTTSGSLTLGGTLSVTPSDFASQTANTFLAAPSGSAGVPTFRAVVAADIPTLNQNTTGSAATLTTTRTLWGQNFNGSANVSGNITDARDITMGTQTNKATLTYTTNTARTYTIPDAGANAEFVLSAGNQNVGGVKTFTSQIINTAANNTNAGAGQIYLNGATGNRIDFNISGVGVPNLFSRTLGSKINLYPSLSTGSATDFAIGLANDGAGAPTRFWQSVDTTNSRFEWFAGATSIATLAGLGQLEINNSGISYTNPTLTLRSTRTATNGSMRLVPQEDGAGGYITFNSSANTTTNGTLISGSSTMTGYHGSRRQGAFQWVGGTADSTSRFEFLTANGGTTGQTMTSRMAITAQGRVGIGTNTPSYNLELVGSIGLNNSNGNGTSLVFDPTNYAILMIDSSANNLFNINEGSTNFYDQSGGAGLYFDRNNTKVGIRTQTPSEALEVDGNIKANNIFHPFLLCGA